jgi:hypothetical protein
MATRHLAFPRHGSQVTEQFMRPERLFAALDGRDVTVSGHRWQVGVYSVTDEAGRRWVQLTLNGRPHYMVTLKLAIGDGVGHAVLALSSWLANPSENSDVLNVA